MEVTVETCTIRTRTRREVLKLKESLQLPGNLWAARARGIADDDLSVELVEFGLVVPLLLMLVIGIVWVGRAFNVYETITRAAREGARYAVLPSSYAAGNAYADLPTASCASNTVAFNNYVAPVLTADSLDPTKVLNYCQKAVWLENTYPQQCGIVVSFTYPVQMEIPFTTLNATTFNIPTQAQMRLENQPTGGTCP
jgi:Flp pilus assembly protein TadG